MRSGYLFNDTQRTLSSHQASCSEFCRVSYALSVLRRRQGLCRATTRCVLAAVETFSSSHDSNHQGVNSTWANALARELHISNEQATNLAITQPYLCSVPPNVLKSRLSVLGDVLSVSSRALADWACKYPVVLEYSKETLLQRVAEFSQTFAVPAAKCECLFYQCPALFGKPAALIRQELAGIAAIVGIPAKRLFVVACKYTAVFALTVSEVEHKVRLFQNLFEQPKSRILRMVARCPQLLVHTVDGLSLKLNALARLLSLKPYQVSRIVSRCPTVLQYSTQRMEEQLFCLFQDISPANVKTMVMRDPEILNKSAAVLLRNASMLQQLLQCYRADMVDLVIRRPSILTCSTKSVASSYRALSIWKFTPEQKLQLFKAHPLLLRLSAREVHGRCRFLRLLMLSSGYYHSVLRKIPLKLLGIVLLHLPYCWPRLLYLAEAEKRCALGVMHAVQCTDAAFMHEFADFSEWKSAKIASVGCEIPWRVEKGIRVAFKGVDKYLIHLAAKLAKQRERDAREMAGAQVFTKAELRMLQAQRPAEMVAVAVHEAKEVLVGSVMLVKPKRVVYERANTPPSTTLPSNGQVTKCPTVDTTPAPVAETATLEQSSKPEMEEPETTEEAQPASASSDVPSEHSEHDAEPTCPTNITTTSAVHISSVDSVIIDNGHAAMPSSMLLNGSNHGQFNGHGTATGLNGSIHTSNGHNYDHLSNGNGHGNGSVNGHGIGSGQGRLLSTAASQAPVHVHGEVLTGNVLLATS